MIARARLRARERGLEVEQRLQPRAAGDLLGDAAAGEDAREDVRPEEDGLTLALDVDVEAVAVLAGFDDQRRAPLLGHGLQHRVAALSSSAK